MQSYYKDAADKYAAIGIDTESVIKKLCGVSISIHCWQGDDVTGFENTSPGTGSGGIQATGNYPGRARNADELMQDFSKAISLIPGKHRINLHACYAITGGEKVERDMLKPKHFAKWISFAKTHGIGIDFNPTFFAHPMVKNSLTLSSPCEDTRAFWVRHGIATRRIAAYIAEELGDTVLYNVWIPDGMKDIPADRLGPRKRLQQSLDEIFETPYSNVIDCVESKVFGIGLEAYTVGSNEFYMAYAASRPNVYNLLDNGHYHPTEQVADKIPSLLTQFDKIPLHVTRPMRWDSDHVVLLTDELKDIAAEIVRCNAMDRVLIGLDFFDASINRIAAWVIGTRNMQKAMLIALLTPWKNLRILQDTGDFTALMVQQEALKVLPFGAVWEEFCTRAGVPADDAWLDIVHEYESAVLLQRQGNSI